MGAIRAAAVADGYETMIDGTNASDECGDRPGMKVLEEQHILSPLRICGLTKSDVRRLSKEAGLFTWDKPAYACLATRILAGEKITAEKLKAIEESEAVLFAHGLFGLSRPASRRPARCCNLRKNSSAGRRRCSEKSRQNC